MTTFVLVHGAYHGGWCYEKIVPLLEAQGHTAIAVDLPGHGDNRIPVGDNGQYPCAGLYASIVEPGKLAVGDRLFVS